MPWLRKASSPQIKSQLEVCGTDIITAFFSVGYSPLYFQPANHIINLAKYFITSLYLLLRKNRKFITTPNIHYPPGVIIPKINS